MKLLFISPSFYPAVYYGGPVYSAYNTAKALADEGIKVFVSTTNANGSKKLDVPVNKFIKVKENLFVKYYGFAGRRGFSPFMFLFLWNDIGKTDIVYLISVFSPPTPLTIFLAFLSGKKIILSPQGQLGEWCLKQGNSFKKLWLLLFIKPFKKIIWNAASEQEKEMILKVFPSAKVIVIPGVVDITEFENAGKEKNFSIYHKLTGRDLSGKKILVSVGRLHQVKGFDILINAFGLLKEKYKELVLLIAGGDFGERKKLEELIKTLGLDERVFLTGNIEGKDKTDFLLNADLFALSSHHESFGVVYAEAMAAGLPVIASKNTPWQDVEKYNCGLWVDNSPEAFAKAIEEILSSDKNKLGEMAKEYISGKFNSQRVAKDYLNLFSLLINDTKRN